jgi:microcystin-dependent protein
MDEIIKVSELQSAYELTGEENFVINQNNESTKTFETRKATLNQIKEFLNNAINYTVSKYVPVGTVQAFSGKVEKLDDVKGWLLCNGDQVSKINYSSLYDVIKDLYTPEGGKPAKNMFFLPNLKGKTIMGFCNYNAVPYIPDVSSFDVWLGGNKITLGKPIGEYTVKLLKTQLGAHSHTDSKGHTHKIFDFFKLHTNVPKYPTGHRQSGRRNFEPYNGDPRSHTYPEDKPIDVEGAQKAMKEHDKGKTSDLKYYSETLKSKAITFNTGGNLSHNNVQPCLGMNYIIKI